MIYSRQFTVLLFSIAAFLQICPTIAVNQDCVDATLAFEPTAGLDYSALESLIHDECGGKTTCNVDLSSWSTNGLSVQDFTAQCYEAGRLPSADILDDSTIPCPTVTATFSNLQLCFPDNCYTVSNAKDTEIEMLKKGGFEYCSDINGSTPTGLIVANVIAVLIGSSIGFCIYRRIVRGRRAKSEVPPATA